MMYFMMHLFKLFLPTIFYQDFKGSIIVACQLTKKCRVRFLSLSALPFPYRAGRELPDHKAHVQCHVIVLTSQKQY